MSKPENPALFRLVIHGDGLIDHGTTMSLRDLFAAFALAGEMAYRGPDSATLEIDTVARKAYQLADAMLAEREEEEFAAEAQDQTEEVVVDEPEWQDDEERLAAQGHCKDLAFRLKGMLREMPYGLAKDAFGVAQELYDALPGGSDEVYHLESVGR